MVMQSWVKRSVSDEYLCHKYSQIVTGLTEDVTSNHDVTTTHRLTDDVTSDVTSTYRWTDGREIDGRETDGRDKYA